MAENKEQQQQNQKNGQQSGEGRALAASAGAMAATAAVFAKLAGSSSSNSSSHLKLACYGAVVACNVAMWTLYVRSLTRLSSLQATVFNFAANFLLSGLAGLVLFGEVDVLQWQWVIGASLIVLGITVLSKADDGQDTKKYD